MSLEFELYEEKRRKMRRFSFLKGSLVTIIVMGIVALFLWNRDLVPSPHIAMFQVTGEIYDDPNRDQILNEMAENENVYGVILKINSPGGTVVGAEALYESLMKISQKKPLVVSIGEVGASAAYLVALAGDKIFARGNSLVGSIGVIVKYPDLSKLAEFLGVSMQVIKSGEAKGGVNFLGPSNERTIKNQESLVNDSFVWFKNLVSERRKLKGIDLERVSDGKLFTGRMALEMGLIDAIGSFDKAITYIETKGIKFQGLSIRDWSLEQNPTAFWKAFFSSDNAILNLNKIKILQSPMLFSIVS